ncbi:aminotransferase class V-fold PLP-dependent enzyme [Portibacter lacus]|uniref:Class V aminotransferase n=1 Tax=Portibacter lacus TaxID=1099794 RepID=A0AA37SQ95_9BACT|nr:aminotransferase class V-fold PLP-dependent enzyme [Portibacter lacus]GLR19036.1 class V aminotransferase [Portibacter lacus]
MDRRNFLFKAGYTIGAASVLPTIGNRLTKTATLEKWDAVRADFQLNTDKIQMAQFLLASHPSKVRKAIDTHRMGLDENTVEYLHHNEITKEEEVLEAAAKYLESSPDEIALTDSTTMGLAILYSGLKLKPGDDILTTTHDHYSTEKALEFAAERNGATIRQVVLYKNPAETSKDEVLMNLKKAILPKTRIVAVTFVHSSTGVKLPIKEMSAVIKEANKSRAESDRIFFCVDGVHGFGVENITVAELGCDFLAAGTHKWLFGPRGTGILWAKKDAWHMVNPIIPPFSIAYPMWMGVMPEEELSFNSKITPGGFHSFEHRWALKEAFEYHLEIGKKEIQNRTHALNTMMKEGMRNIKHVHLHTPLSNSLSSGINSFEVKGMDAEKVIQKLHKINIIGSTTPYKTIYARLTPCIINTEEEVKQCIRALEKIND